MLSKVLILSAIVASATVPKFEDAFDRLGGSGSGKKVHANSAFKLTGLPSNYANYINDWWKCGVGKTGGICKYHMQCIQKMPGKSGYVVTGSAYDYFYIFTTDGTKKNWLGEYKNVKFGGYTMNHAGGCQAVGKYVAVGLEKYEQGAKSPSKVVVFDMSNPTSPKMMETGVERQAASDSNTSGAIGLVEMKDFYLLAVGNYHSARVDFYSLNKSTMKLIKKLGTQYFKSKMTGWQNINLFPPQNPGDGYFWLVGLGTGGWPGNADRAELHKFAINANAVRYIQKVNDKHFARKGDGPRFKYGGGMTWDKTTDDIFVVSVESQIQGDGSARVSYWESKGNLPAKPIAQCNRPASGCVQSTDVYQHIDCDGDGILDHVCTTTVNDNRWVALSSKGDCSTWVPDKTGKCKAKTAKGYCKPNTPASRIGGSKFFGGYSTIEKCYAERCANADTCIAATRGNDGSCIAYTECTSIQLHGYFTTMYKPATFDLSGSSESCMNGPFIKKGTKNGAPLFENSTGGVVRYENTEQDWGYKQLCGRKGCWTASCGGHHRHVSVTAEKKIVNGMKWTNRGGVASGAVQTVLSGIEAGRRRTNSDWLLDMLDSEEPDMDLA